MDDMQAAEILKVLAAGTGPAAGQSPAEPAHLQSAEVLRALFLGADALQTRAKAGRRQSALPRNAGKPWTAEEDERLLAGFDAGRTMNELVAAHERTRAGIEARLVKHGRLEVGQAPSARIR